LRTQALLRHPQEHAQRRALEIGIVFQEAAQPLGHRKDPLAHRQRRQDVIGDLRRGRDHAPGVARGANAPALAREGYRQVVTTLPATRPGKAMSEDSAFQVTAELPVTTPPRVMIAAGMAAAVVVASD